MFLIHCLLPFCQWFFSTIIFVLFNPSNVSLLRERAIENETFYEDGLSISFVTNRTKPSFKLKSASSYLDLTWSSSRMLLLTPTKWDEAKSNKNLAFVFCFSKTIPAFREAFKRILRKTTSLWLVSCNEPITEAKFNRVTQSNAITKKRALMTRSHTFEASIKKINTFWCTNLLLNRRKL